MNVLGISALDNDATAALFVGGRLRYVIAEERISREKLHKGFPGRAVAEILDRAGLRPADIDVVAYPFSPWPKESRQILAAFLCELGPSLFAPLPLGSKFVHLGRHALWTREAIGFHRRFHRELDRELAALGLLANKEIVEHHEAHAAAAFYTSNFPAALVVTVDWYGSGLAGSVSVADAECGIRRIKDIPFPHSMGMFYAGVTAALGFTPNRHEGKIVGLAAYARPGELLEQVMARFRQRPGDFRWIGSFDNRFTRALCREYPREQVAAAYQTALERVVTEFVAHYVRQTGMKRVALAGGVFANVKLNQRVYEIPGVEAVYVHPGMGDGGTGVGAGLAVLARRGRVRPSRFENLFLAPPTRDGEVEALLRAEAVAYERMADPAERIAELLAADHVVARYAGAMEYGPRALGNRSILYPATDPTVNDWLNHRLGRSEFMPFAPATLIEEAARCYVNHRGAEYTAEFMTITFDCTDYMKKTSPAAVHVDGTARPQLVHSERNPGFYRILAAYRARTGIPTLINTSFNMHEEPIVKTPHDALRAFRQGRLPYLVLDDFLVAGDVDDLVEEAARGAARR
ncbi:MAG: carbamoyltransferase [Planctomycetes bacterium]|nr:carbamoyltransferase [Planctomycetota bacterium]